jgi:hypothetical protein
MLARWRNRGPSVGSKTQVVFHGKGTEDQPSLGHMGDACAHDLLRAAMHQIRVLEKNAALAGPDQPGNGAEHGRLARAVAADEGHYLALAHVQVARRTA